MGEAFDPAYLKQIRERLTAIDDLGRRRTAALQGPVAPKSPAARDAALPDARFVRIYAGHTSFAALDNLLAWRIIAHYSPLMPVLGQVTLLRGAIENADRCRWHVDHKLGPGKRVGRALAGRYDDQQHRNTFDVAKGPGPRGALGPRGRTALQRLKQLDDPDAIQSRKEAGVEPAGYGDPTSVTASYGHHRWYRLASGVAHAKEWVLPYVADLDPSTDGGIEDGTHSGRFSVSEKFTSELTDVAVRASEAAVRALERYFGAKT
jgi:hypothetical protein